MRNVSKGEFLDYLKVGDIGLNLSRNIFAWFQNLYRKRMNEGSARASHGWFIKIFPFVSEANGVLISGNKKVIRFIGNRTKVWVFRYVNLDPLQLERMVLYATSAEKTGGHYSFGGIWGFAVSFLTKKKDWKDKPGVFCSEYTSQIIRAGKIPDYIKGRDSWEISPSLQLNWFLSEGGSFGWILAAHYDGKGNYTIAD